MAFRDALFRVACKATQLCWTDTGWVSAESTAGGIRREPFAWPQGWQGTLRRSDVPGLPDVLSEPRPRALDLRGLGARRVIQLSRVGGPRDRVRVRRRARTRPLDGAGRDGR